MKVPPRKNLPPLQGPEGGPSLPFKKKRKRKRMRRWRRKKSANAPIHPRIVHDAEKSTVFWGK